MSKPSNRSASPRFHGSALVRPGRNRELVLFEIEVVDFFVTAVDLLGVPKSVAAIYGIIFASAEPLTFADVESRLDMSKGSISQGLRFLREVGALQTVPRRDGLDAFVPEVELRKLIDYFLETRLRRQLEESQERLVRIAKQVPGRDAGAALLKHRMQSLAEWNSKARKILPLAQGILKLAP